MIKSQKEKGFTLIELLVVIGIIAVLSAVVFAYLGSARKKGNDAAVKSNLATVRTSMDLVYLNNTNNPNSYTRIAGQVSGPAACPTPAQLPNLASLFMLFFDKPSATALATALSRGNGSSYCYNDDNNWAVAIGLNTDTTKSWCVDSKPSAQIESSIPSLSLNATTHLCN